MLGQLALHLAEHYGVSDPHTGGPLPEEQLRPVLREIRQSGAAPGDPPVTDEPAADHEPAVADEPPMADSGVHQSGDASHPFFGPGELAAGEASPRFGWSDAAEPYPVEPVPVPVPSASVGDLRAGGGVRQQRSASAPSAATREAVTEEPATWEATVSDTGEATARVPEQQTQETDLDAVQQQVVTVAQWLTEADEAGRKLSGAEVARRLELSPKTGQRRVSAATKYLEEQRRQQGRTHLRSVRH